MIVGIAKMQEAKVWEEIEKKKAKERKQATQFGNTVVDNVPPPSEEGKTRDILAEKVNLGSGKTYDRAKIAGVSHNAYGGWPNATYLSPSP